MNKEIFGSIENVCMCMFSSMYIYVWMCVCACVCLFALQSISCPIQPHSAACLPVCLFVWLRFVCTKGHFQGPHPAPSRAEIYTFDILVQASWRNWFLPFSTKLNSSVQKCPDLRLLDWAWVCVCCVCVCSLAKRKLSYWASKGWKCFRFLFAVHCVVCNSKSKGFGIRRGFKFQHIFLLYQMSYKA